jgi:hypothetical protein
MNDYDHNLQELWDMIKRPNLRIHGVEGAEIYTKSIGNLLNEIIAENFSTLGERYRHLSTGDILNSK